MSLVQPGMMISARAHISTSISKASWRVSFQRGNRQAWWMAISNAISGPGLGLKCESVSGRAISFKGGREEHNHTLAGIGACATTRWVYLPGSSWWLIPEVYGQIQWWRVDHRQKSWTVQLQRQQLTSRAQFWHSDVQLQSEPCWKRWQACYLEVKQLQTWLVNHQLGLLLGMRHQSIKG